MPQAQRLRLPSEGRPTAPLFVQAGKTGNHHAGAYPGLSGAFEEGVYRRNFAPV